MYQYITRRGPVAAAVLIIYWAALFIATHIPMAPGKLHIPYADKVMHFVAYTGLALLAAIILRTPTWRRSTRYLMLWSMIAAYGALDELCQMMVPGRSAEFADWGADLLGAATGILLFILLRKMAHQFGWLNIQAAGNLAPKQSAAAPASR